MIAIAASIVSYFSDDELLTATVRGLAAAARHANCFVHLTLVDNSTDARDTERLSALTQSWASWLDQETRLSLRVISTRRNLGYGGANNQALVEARGEFILILNPDAVLDPEALSIALKTFARDKTCVLVAPRALNTDGQDLFLGHGYPTLLALAGRSIKALRRFSNVRESMKRYELRELNPTESHQKTVCVSGCCMLIRHQAWRDCGGFNRSFFLYFEDYDLSLRLRKLGRICYEPAVRLTHFGGDASGKGWRHTRLFITSMLRFFVHHGWRWS